MIKTVLVAMGNSEIPKIINEFDNYEVLEEVRYREDLVSDVDKMNPDILLISEGIAGQEPLIPTLIKLSKNHPHLRIVYLAGDVDIRDKHTTNSLGMLVINGIYDVLCQKKITPKIIEDLLNNPLSEADVEHLTFALNSEVSKKNHSSIEFDIPVEDGEEVDDGSINNVFVVSSIKPGTGKSFLSVNIATAIAAFGVENSKGKRPSVALIEADLQNLSVGTLLGIEDDSKKNIRTVIEKIDKITTSSRIVGSELEVEQTDEFILESFKPFRGSGYALDNLKSLVGSDLKFSDMGIVKPQHYAYLLDVVSRHFDVVIVDSNSSLSHVTTAPLLGMAKYCYYVLNLDFNNIRNNVRYKDDMNDAGYGEKVKYILNEEIEGTEEDIEPLMFNSKTLEDSGFKLEAKVPIIPKAKFLNRISEGIPLILNTDRESLIARHEIMKVANQIYNIKNLEEIETDVQKFLKKKKKKRLF